MSKPRFVHTISLTEEEERLLRKAAKKYGGIKKAIVRGLFLLVEKEKKLKQGDKYENCMF